MADIVKDFSVLADDGKLTGIFPDIPMEIYHQKLPGISKTDIESASLSMANMVARKLAKESDNEALLVGSLLHSRIEHKDDLKQYQSLFVVMPEFSGKGSVAEKNKWREENAGKTVLDEGQVQLIENLFYGLSINPQSKALMDADGTAEETIFWTDPDSGVLCKCRPDKYIPDYLGAPMTIDWKTLGRFGIRGCSEAINEYGYFVSAAFTIDGLRAVGREAGPFTLVFIEKAQPHRVLCVPVEDIDIEIGRKKYKKVLRQIAESKRTNIWPGFVSIGMSDWARQREMEQLVGE